MAAITKTETTTTATTTKTGFPSTNCLLLTFSGVEVCRCFCSFSPSRNAYFSYFQGSRCVDVFARFLPPNAYFCYFVFRGPSVYMILLFSLDEMPPPPSAASSSSLTPALARTQAQAYAQALASGTDTRTGHAQA